MKTITFKTIILISVNFVLSCGSNMSTKTTENLYYNNVTEIIKQKVEEFAFLGPRELSNSVELPIELRRKLYLDDTLRCCLFADIATIDKYGKKKYLLNDTICDDLLAKM
jgi:hypothetical protein